jgi:hypothetical protein
MRPNFRPVASASGTIRRRDGGSHGPEAAGVRLRFRFGCLAENPGEWGRMGLAWAG